MYGQQDLSTLRDLVEDLGAEYKSQKKTLHRLIGGMITSLAIIAFSAVLNGSDALSNGGNGGVIAACVLSFICLGVGLIYFLSEIYEEDLGDKFRKSARDLKRREQADGEV